LDGAIGQRRVKARARGIRPIDPATKASGFGTSAERVAVRQERAKPLVDDLRVWMRQQRDRLAPSHDLAKAINYILSRWVAFTRFLDNGRICLSNNAAERAVRCVAVGRKN
jgi:transposase